MGAARNEDGPVRGDTSGRGAGAGVAIAASLLVALLLAAPILYHRIGESRQRLDQLLRRARSVREGEFFRVARIRAALDGRVEECGRGQDEVLTYLEAGVQRLLPRPINEVRLPEALPLPEDVVPAVLPKGEATPPAAAGHAEPAEPSRREFDERTREQVRLWVTQLTRQLGLTGPQQERCQPILEDYLVAFGERTAQAREGQRANVYQDIQACRNAAIQDLESLLTAEQRSRYQDLKKSAEKWRQTGVILAPLPGTTPPRR